MNKWIDGWINEFISGNQTHIEHKEKKKVTQRKKERHTDTRNISHLQRLAVKFRYCLT